MQSVNDFIHSVRAEMQAVDPPRVVYHMESLERLVGATALLACAMRAWRASRI